MSEPFVVEVVRSGAVESTHLVDVAVVDRRGRLIASAGDPDVRAAFRSSAKPMQARASLEAGFAPAREELLAVACASHNGEPTHVEAVRAILAGSGLDDAALQCPSDVPMDATAALSVPQRAPIFHNCSGKHAAALAACAASGWPLETYREPDHPLQVRSHGLIEGYLGPMEGPLVDGCGFPTYVAPLRTLARALLAVVDGREAAAMRAHPFMVAGTGRLDTDLMSAQPSIVIKGGAEGLACLAAGDAGIAVKARDGAARPRGPVVLAVLEELGLIEPGLLPAHREPVVLGGGKPVGVARARGSLARA